MSTTEDVIYCIMALLYVGSYIAEMFTYHPVEKQYWCHSCGHAWEGGSRCNCPKRCPKCGKRTKVFKKKLVKK